MAIIKSFTDISQSNTLSNILPLESADMHSEAIDINGDMVFIVISGLGDKTKSNYGSPVWSLAALLDVLPKIGSEEPMIQKLYYANTPTERYICQYSLTNITGEYDNPVDACVAMIEKLHELNLL